ncbi:MAG TPA: hypothetical protein PLP29_06900 [Candidatus Ozemobacteraceae bacterium]|nr:hypothetical protein [Candidatus Ozemobacteraceae bacterium]
MNTRLFSALILGALGIAPLLAGPQMQFTLKDRSVLRGELVEMKDGVYRIRSGALGELRIPADQIALIATADAASVPVPPVREDGPKRPTPERSQSARPSSTAPASDNLAEQQKNVNTQVQSMLMNGSFLDGVTGLGESPDMQNVMQDEEIMKAIQSGDYEFLMKNEKMKQLIESPEMQNILGGMSE